MGGERGGSSHQGGREGGKEEGRQACLHFPSAWADRPLFSYRGGNLPRGKSP